MIRFSSDKMKYGLSKTNPPPEEDERWKTVMKNSIDFLKFEIGLLKLELQKSKLKIEELTPNYPGFQNYGFHHRAPFQVTNAWPQKPSIDIRPSCKYWEMCVHDTTSIYVYI
ncbi:hypothetical protein J6590_010714 [Homalodisca vitripennis]|nr:hypothetical protein J6590_010714 [Homalodisca vitripennis]